MAFSLEAEVYLATYASWPRAEDDERHGAWVHGQHARLATEVGRGVYIGDSDFSRRPDRFMAPAKVARLEEIRPRRDPHALLARYFAADGASLNGAARLRQAVRV